MSNLIAKKALARRIIRFYHSKSKEIPAGLLNLAAFKPEDIGPAYKYAKDTNDFELLKELITHYKPLLEKEDDSEHEAEEDKLETEMSDLLDELEEINDEEEGKAVEEEPDVANPDEWGSDDENGPFVQVVERSAEEVPVQQTKTVNDRNEPIITGDFVSWFYHTGANNGVSSGKVLEFKTEGSLEGTVGGPVFAQDNDPVMLVQIWENNSGWAPTDKTVAKSLHSLTKIPPLDSNSHKDYEVEDIVTQAGVVEDFNPGDWVKWDSPGGHCQGQISRVVKEGSLNVPDRGFSVTAKPNNPICVIDIWQSNGGEWTKTNEQWILPASGLVRIDALKALTRADIAKLKGITFKDNKIETSRIFSIKGGLNDEEINSDGPSGFVVSQPGQMALINKTSLKPLAEDDVLVVTLQSADSEVDRSFERFTSEAIDKMVSLSAGKPVLRDHVWDTKNIVGKIFDAKNSGGKLIQYAYIPRSASNKDVVENIENGIFNKLSVGFAIDPDYYICDACGYSAMSYECKHQPGDTLMDGSEVTVSIKDVADYFEVSLVAVPCQRDAKILNSAKNYDDFPAFKRFTELLNNPPESVKKLLNDTMFNGKDTIKGSLSMEETDKPTEEVKADEEATSGVDHKAVDDGQENLKSVHEGLQHMHDLLKSLHASHQEMADKVKSIHESALPGAMDMHHKSLAVATDCYNMVKALHNSILPGATDENHKSLLKDMEELHKKLDLAMSIPSEGVKRLVLEEKSQEKKNWVHARFGQDLGGQE